MQTLNKSCNADSAADIDAAADTNADGQRTVKALQIIRIVELKMVLITQYFADTNMIKQE